jgi:exoribonuclease II
MTSRAHDLTDIARRAMLEHGLAPDFPPAALAEVRALDASSGPPAGQTAPQMGDGIRDLRELLWASIDNDDSRDLDQLTVAQPPGGARGKGAGARTGDAVTLLIAIADVDAHVAEGSAIDDHARTNTTSVYTAAGIFPMLPERLSTDLTSLNAHEERLAVVIEMTIEGDGTVSHSDV